MVLPPKFNCTLIQNAYLTDTQFRDVLNLFEICKIFDQTTPKIYLNILKTKRNHNANFLVYVDDTRLIGFLSFFFFDTDCAEISAFVHPDYRHQGVFKYLFALACKNLLALKIDRIHFVLSQKNTIAQQSAQDLHAQFTHYEYHMERAGDVLESLPVFDRTHDNMFAKFDDLQIKKAKSEDVQILANIDAKCFGSDYATMLHRFQDTITHSNREAWLCYHQEVYIGKAHVLFDTNGAYLHDIGIIPEYQKHGYGTFLLKCIINHLVESKRCTKLYLEVTASNESAINLYKKCHFKIKDAYEYWMFNIPVA